jgi:hypothetical protein
MAFLQPLFGLEDHSPTNKTLTEAMPLRLEVGVSVEELHLVGVSEPNLLVAGLAYVAEDANE